MHELAIANSLLHLATEHVPPGTAPRLVRVSAGPLRSIDPDALRFAWESLLHDHPWQNAKLEFHELPWQMRCPDCDARWESPRCNHLCSCGCERAYPCGGNELILDSIDIDEHCPSR
jgi:hydrogenase nickel incorporation protein HypA/HybF